MKGDSYVYLFPPEPDDSWRLDAACLGLGDLFFMERGYSSTAAKTICATCPVIQDCLDYAIATRTQFGIWGGLSYKERKAVMRKRRRAAA